MINKFVSSFALFLISFTAFADHPKEDVEKWLAKMHNAAHMLNYEGTFVYGQNNEMTSMQIIHSVDKNGEFERLISLDGSGREVIRSGDTVTCILPDKNSVVVDKSRPDTEFPPTFPIKIQQLQKFYNFHFGQDGMVAGRTAIKLMIEPKDEYRYGHALWVDKKTGLLLKDHLVGDNEKIVEQFMFTQIKYPTVIEKVRLISDSKNKKYTWYEAKDEPIEKEVKKSMNWKVMKVPTGFVSGIERHHKMTMSAMPVEHFMYSDGLSSVSVFVEKQMKESKNLMGSSTMGAVNAYGRAIGKYHVTVVGEVPHATVKMIGDSVEHISN
ncbi:MAG: MucB/RseB C-terminal domain-containing protein [Gammaproteobacteria bacterium]|nr:MucB/RseB C-terminal domain-containing protein [Gammaproteobacteria bacterium]